MAEAKVPLHQVHAILLPYPLQGHVIPFVHLATKLASNGFTVTFVNTEAIHHQITKSSVNQQPGGDGEDIFARARRSGLDIRYATVSDGFPLDFDRSLNHDQFFEGILEDFPAQVDELVGQLMVEYSSLGSGDRGRPAVNCLVADTFYVFSSAIARKHNLVNVSFWTEPALVFTLYYHMDLLRENGHYDNFDKRECDDVITYIPGVKEIKPTDLPSYLQIEPTTLVHQIIHKAFADVRKADFVITNTVQEFESTTISALQESQPFYAIGPIFPETNATVATSMWPEADCASWLDAKPAGSVLYVSFGSYAHTTKHDIVEIAHGLVSSKVNFLWVLRSDIVSSNETDYLPDGFDRLIQRCGLIVPWCSQGGVLSHPAIGGFLTHCGWNSILESVWCSVPMICYPLLTDQFTNRKLVVDDWKIGIDLRDTREVKRDKVSEKIRCLMREKSADDFKEEIRKVKKTLVDALAIGGSSRKNLHQFVRDVEDKVVKLQQS